MSHSRSKLLGRSWLLNKLRRHQGWRSRIRSRPRAKTYGVLGQLGIELLEDRCMLSMVPIYHSGLLPDGSGYYGKKIFLDFDGEIVTDTHWTQHNNHETIHAPAYDIDDNPDEFSTEELANIETIWRYVAEDFAPFQVDVTTAAPEAGQLVNGNGIRVLFSAWRDSVTGYNWAETLEPGNPQFFGYSRFDAWFNYASTPIWVFANEFKHLGEDYGDIVFDPLDPSDPNNNPIPQSFAGTIASHEVGHTFNLTHDGGHINGEHWEYFPGHGGTGETSWGPIMGGAEPRNLTQWSKGEYSQATNGQDDLAILTGFFQSSALEYREDDHSDSTTNVSEASPLTLNGIQIVPATGIISESAAGSGNNDIDVFQFVVVGTGPSAVAIHVDPVDVGPNLDVAIQLYNSSGTALLPAPVNPVDEIDAGVLLDLVPGTYLLSIDGVGKDDVAGDGYSDYGSLGQYTITGTIAQVPRVTNVKLTSSTWSVWGPQWSEYSFDTVDGSGEQLRTVPLAGIDGASVTFSRPVDFTSSNFTMFNATTLTYAGIDSGSFAYDAGTNTVSFEYAQDLAAGQYYLKAWDNIVDTQSGLKLDGEWINPHSLAVTIDDVSEFPSGDGTPGGSFVFALTVLPGDVDRDNDQDMDDYELINSWEWHPLSDFNNDGQIDSADADDFYSYLGSAQHGWDLSALRVVADFNDDLAVDTDDWNSFVDHWGTAVNPWEEGDANGDGFVDLDDYAIIRGVFGLQVVKNVPPPSSGRG